MANNAPSDDRSVTSLPITRAETTAWAMNHQLVPANMVTMSSEIDATAIKKLRGMYMAKGLLPPTMTAIIVKAAALTMAAYPEANRAILGWPGFRKLYQFKNTNISVAVEKSLPYLPGLAFATPLENSFGKSLAALSQELRDLATCNETNNPRFKVYMRMLRWLPTPLSLFLINLPIRVPSLWVQHRGCAAWVNAPSKAGVDSVTTTWPWPISFSFGFVKLRPRVVENKVEARLTMPLIMAFDRRIMGGGPAGRIFAHFKNVLEKADETLFEFEAKTTKTTAGPEAKEHVSI